MCLTCTQVRNDHVVAVDNMRALMRVCLGRGDAAKTAMEQAVATRDAHHALDMQKMGARTRELVSAGRYNALQE